LALREWKPKLTAVLYTRSAAAAHLRETGRLPDRIGGFWSVLPMRLLVEGGSFGW
jgi:hypothetical protein